VTGLGAPNGASFPAGDVSLNGHLMTDKLMQSLNSFLFTEADVPDAKPPPKVNEFKSTQIPNADSPTEVIESGKVTSYNPLSENAFLPIDTSLPPHSTVRRLEHWKKHPSDMNVNDDGRLTPGRLVHPQKQ
jgi:hypothetical protein